LIWAFEQYLLPLQLLGFRILDYALPFSDIHEEERFAELGPQGFRCLYTFKSDMGATYRAQQFALIAGVGS
jgi:hypothetical protein